MIALVLAAALLAAPAGPVCAPGEEWWPTETGYVCGPADEADPGAPEPADQMLADPIEDVQLPLPPALEDRDELALTGPTRDAVALAGTSAGLALLATGLGLTAIHRRNTLNPHRVRPRYRRRLSPPS